MRDGLLPRERVQAIQKEIAGFLLEQVNRPERRILLPGSFRRKCKKEDVKSNLCELPFVIATKHDR
jgi:hypothetical protein